MTNKYFVNNQDHRVFTGSGDPEIWNTIGKLQLDVCVANGLLPNMKFIDIGCGSLRGGVHFVRYMGQNYFGIDKYKQLIDAGLEVELPALGLQSSYDNFDVNDKFDISKFNTVFDMGLAQSVFTHLPLERLVECLDSIYPYFKVGGRFIVTLYINNRKPQTMEYDLSYRLKPITIDGVLVEVPNSSLRPYNPNDPENNDGMKSFVFQSSTVESILPSLNNKWKMTAVGQWLEHPRWPSLYVFEKLPYNQ